MWYLLGVEFMEADVYSVVVGFVAGEGFPFPDGFLYGVVGGVEALGVGAFLGGFFHLIAEVGDGCFG